MQLHAHLIRDSIAQMCHFQLSEKPPDFSVHTTATGQADYLPKEMDESWRLF